MRTTAAAPDRDAPTRERVARSILENGPSTAAALAERLELTPAAVRRHLDHLAESGTVEAREQKVYGHRGRGRPARVFALTDAGRDAFDQQYDDLAVAALRFLAETEGDDAVMEFARRRVAFVERDYAAVMAEEPDADARPRPWPGSSPPSGYAATVRELPDRRPALPAALPGRPRGPRVPAAVRGRDRGHRPGPRHARPAAGDHRPRRRRLHDLHPQHDRHHPDHEHRPRAPRRRHDLHRRAQPRAPGHRPLRVRLVRLRRRRRHRDPRAERGRRPRHLREEERAAVDARPAPEGPQALPPQADADLGLRPQRASTSTTSSTSSAPARSRRPRGTTSPRTSRTPTTSSASPRRRSSASSSGVAAQYESEVVYHSIREDLEEQGVLFLDTDTALREHPELFQEYFGTVIPVGDNKFAALNTCGVVRRLVHLRAQGRPRRHPAAGLLPDQHREHGPVRADADHRRRGRLRALRRGLHRADLLLRLAALRRRRDHREEGRPLPLHDHPELVEQRLQPRHQARHLRGRRDHGVGRRQHRLQGDDEVPRHLPDGRARQGRDAVDRLRRRGPAPGRRRQDGARRARTPRARS